MKKKLSVIAVIILVLAICVSAWFYGYYNHKSNDNLPTLAAIAEMSEADVNSLLPGYHIDQLREVWGKPDTSENGTACWKIGNDTILVVSYKNNVHLDKRELVGARPLHLAAARPFCHLKAPLGLSLFRFAPQTRICYSPMEVPRSSLRPQIATIPLFL